MQAARLSPPAQVRGLPKPAPPKESRSLAALVMTVSEKEIVIPSERSEREICFSWSAQKGGPLSAIRTSHRGGGEVGFPESNAAAARHSVVTIEKTIGITKK